MAQQTITLTPGQITVLPAGAQIDSWTATGDAGLTSSCGNLPTQDELCCIAFRFADTESGGSPDGALEQISLTSIEIGGTVFDMGDYNLDGNGSLTDIANDLNALVNASFYIYGVIVDVQAQHIEWAISARVACSMVDSIKFEMTGLGFNRFLVIADELDDCDCALPNTNNSSAIHCDDINT